MGGESSPHACISVSLMLTERFLRSVQLLSPGVLCLVPPCAAAGAVVIPLRSLAGVVPPVQDKGVGVVGYGAAEESYGAAGLGYGHADEACDDERAESRPRAGPAEHLRALSGRIREDYRVLTEGRGIGNASHQEYPKHDVDESGEFLKPGGREIAAEYEGQTAAYHAEEAPEHALAAADLVKQRSGEGTGKTAYERAEECILQRVRRAVKAAVHDLDHHRERGGITGERTE